MEKPQLIKDLGMLYFNNKSKVKRRYGLFKCDCGTIFKSNSYAVKSGHTSSCGCYAKKGNNTKHNLKNHRIYTIFNGMKARCYNKNSEYYEYYGGKGVIICDEWFNDFMSFYNWAINNNYDENLSIDRIDNDGNYEPNNCRWATKEVQMRNRRRLQKNNTSGYRGVSFDTHLNKYHVQIGVGGKKVHLGNYTIAIEGAKAYDQYVIENNLEHTRNFN